MIKTSKLIYAGMDRGVIRRLQQLLSELGKTFHQRVPLDHVQTMLGKYGYTLVNEDGTPWSALISLPFEKNVTFQIPIAILNGEPDPNKQYQETGDSINVSLYRHGKGSIEFTAYMV